MRIINVWQYLNVNWKQIKHTLKTSWPFAVENEHECLTFKWPFVHSGQR